MKVVVLTLILLLQSAFGCALCSLYSPTAHTEISFIEDDDKIKDAKVKWIFSENFTELTFKTYDINSNLKLEEDELSEIQKALLDYLEPKDYLMDFSYYDGEEKSKKLNLKTNEVKTAIEDGRLVFTFLFPLNLDLKDGRVIRISIFDTQEYFNFKIADSSAYETKSGLFINPNINLNIAFYEIDKEKKTNSDKPSLASIIPKNTNLSNADESPKYDSTQNATLDSLKDIDRIDEEKYNLLAKVSTNYLDNLKMLIKDSSGSGVFAILLVSFVYGFLHAAGPGHGKLLTASYFAANRASYMKAINLSLKIGFLHVIGALILVYVMMFVINAFITKATNEAASITTKISAVIIILIAIFMIFTKLKIIFKSKKIKFKTISDQSKTYTKIFNCSNSNHEHNGTCGCVCASFSSGFPRSVYEWMLVFAAALVPCPGTVLVFVLAFSLGSFGIALASALMIGLGMASVIFIAAVFGKSMNDSLFKFKNLRVYLEFLALALMIALGIYMFIISSRVSVL
ncbi:HoxN/HupN/NixA family nickel/cobalt transporter [Campylobacter fetus]|uniref:HoxN/HupN/NixA family nickel/cobalt transporter n=1 Tax=Campylobacter fetus TaxID=196 RepID=UPI000FCBA34D|nr:DUF1007 family protein [Campylobacter fetus]RUT49286.1 hypothetical protein BWK67_06910 [Campylobacter fetus]RUT49546.1 hypothetical protein BWK51_06890 [Campylobacter fetus]